MGVTCTTTTSAPSWHSGRVAATVDAHSGPCDFHESPVRSAAAPSIGSSGASQRSAGDPPRGSVRIGHENRTGHECRRDSHESGSGTDAGSEPRWRTGRTGRSHRPGRQMLVARVGLPEGGTTRGAPTPAGRSNHLPCAGGAAASHAHRDHSRRSTTDMGSSSSMRTLTMESSVVRWWSDHDSPRPFAAKRSSGLSPM